ncbi:hypothetical protein [Thermomonospora echinospora]|uniref:hypothetical protein n=1 Tax=Thermomonospora echinospora TaxID=1992 RepID=UPI002E15425C
MDRLQGALQTRGADGTVASGTLLLTEIQAEIVAELARHDLREMQQHPCCSLTLLVVHEDVLEIVRVGDAVGVLCGDSLELEISTGFFDAREAAAVEQARAQDLTMDEITSAMYRRRSEYIRGINGESVFSGHPDGNLFAHSLLVPRRRGAGFVVLLCTDGLARAVTEYRLFADWPALLNACLAKGVDAVITEMRAFEDAAESVAGKFKKSDDVAAVLLQV